MTHDELLAKFSNDENGYAGSTPLQRMYALRAVVELHKPVKERDGYFTCNRCISIITGDGGYMHHKYPCSTIQAIEKELG
jgi:hypothetical protein